MSVPRTQMSVLLLGHCMSAGSAMPCHAKSLHIQGLTLGQHVCMKRLHWLLLLSACQMATIICALLFTSQHPN